MAALQGFHHVKLPVTDVERTRDWYARVLSFTVELEFVEDGVLMGVAMRDASGTVPLAFRCDPDRAKAMAGFDPIAIGVPSVPDLEEWRAHLTSLGEAHGGIVTGHVGSVLVGLHDPDGIEVRLYTLSGGAS
ncbi:MAG: VOC family protein [Actinophytocola sp.]|uniref:VOC family protein n=1 Tax=Actinophytocola sp. TaxID=1872138 RepID=UPI00132BA766|nr:VOC family protein [Actinophytocola sp.]MPZ85506.1 VOC family protein [Actinophytocola sp.]